MLHGPVAQQSHECNRRRKSIGCSHFLFVIYQNTLLPVYLQLVRVNFQKLLSHFLEGLTSFSHPHHSEMVTRLICRLITSCLLAIPLHMYHILIRMMILGHSLIINTLLYHITYHTCIFFLLFLYLTMYQIAYKISKYHFSLDSQNRRYLHDNLPCLLLCALIGRAIQMLRPSIHLKLLVSLHFSQHPLCYLPSRMLSQLQELKWGVMSGFHLTVQQLLREFEWLVQMNCYRRLLTQISIPNLVFDTLLIHLFIFL